MSSSKRQREPPLRYTEDAGPSKVARGAFSDLEDAQLLSALLKHGPVDIAKLTEMIPTRNEYQVKQRISSLQRKAQRSLTTLNDPSKKGAKFQTRQKVALDQWLDDLVDEDQRAQIMGTTNEALHVRMLASCMSFIAKYEDHPKPEECAGVDLKNVYEFLEHVMLGQPSKSLENADAKFLIESLQRLSFMIDNADVEKETDFLQRGRPLQMSKEKPRTYGKREECTLEESDDDDFVEQLNILVSTKFNPFQVPKKLIKRCQANGK